MMSTQKTAPGPALSSASRMRRWQVAGWIAVVVALVVWTGVNLRFGVSWEDRWIRTAPSNQNWDGGDVTLSVADVWVGTSVQLDDGRDDKHVALPGAVWFVVLMDYELPNPDIATVCVTYLLGDDREWFGTVSTDSWLSGSDVFPGTRWGCDNADRYTGERFDSGQFARVFEIPESALGEIRGLRIAVSRELENQFDVSEALKSPRATIVLPLEVPS